VGALAVLGQAEQAKEWIVRALMIDADNLLMRYNFACALAVHLKDAEAALEQLTPVLEGGPARLIHAARTDPDLDPVRGDPRFAVMLAKAEARLAKTAG
jgi:adenylate cyclase